MTLGRRIPALAVIAALIAGLSVVVPTEARAQSVSIALSPTLGDSVSPAPIITVTGIGVGPEFAGAHVTLDISLQSNFNTRFFADSARGLTGQFQLDSLLTAHETVFFRARLIDGTGTTRATSIVSKPVHSLLRLIFPAHTLDVLFTHTPTFVFSVPGISTPPGPWIFIVNITNNATGAVLQSPPMGDTTFTSPPLDACTSYRWAVSAVPQGQPTGGIHLSASGTFVLQTPDCPSVTTFYQNFPNPFGRGERSNTTCFWFDLAHRSTVSLIVYDVRLRPVRTIVPNPLLPAQLDSGAYGRQNLGNDSGCDEKVLWDGRDQSGRAVPPGIYLAVFKADGFTQSRKILYKGP